MAVLARSRALAVRPDGPAALTRRAPTSGPVLPAVVAVVAMLAVAGCADHPDAAQRQRGPFAVGTRTMTFVDHGRPTPSTPGLPGAPSRTLPTDVWYPARGRPSGVDVPDARPAEGPFPLVVFSHGQNAVPGQYAPVLHAWGRAGYVVAAPHHPLSAHDAPAGQWPGDFVHQPADLSFVITQMDRQEGDLVDVDHVAVAGHSSGAITALGAGFNTCCHDDRIDAVLLEAVEELPFSGRFFDDLPDTPVLFLHGDADPSFPLALGRTVFDDASPPKFFLTIGGGGHSDPYRAGPPDSAVVARAGVDFFDRYLKDRDDALTALRRDVARYPFAHLEADPD